MSKWYILASFCKPQSAANQSYQTGQFLIGQKLVENAKKCDILINFQTNASATLNFISGDWFVLYQMSKNLNQRFFAEFITVLALTVNPDPNIEPEEPEIYLTEADLERRRNGRGSKSSSRKSSISSGSGSGSGSGSDDDDDDNNRRKGNPLMRCEGDIDTSLEAAGGGGAGGLSGKQRMLIKQGKGAMGAKHNAMKSGAALKRLRSRR